MKTQNSTKWCNLYLNESKYNLVFRRSRYQRAVYFGLLLSLVLLIVVSYTYAYQIALLYAVLAFIGLSLYLGNKDTQSADAIGALDIDETGTIRVNQEAQTYQLLNSSRCGFLGCWLNLQTTDASQEVSSAFRKRIFVFKDSLRSADFSTLARIIYRIQKTKI